eukprot:CAMPEP_0203758580 /NCGR_PEP_ID=MMETSP0098-20131031/11439_1 /ASSEMBLY_ACC=CAM_ASM_000208 /TAXON_ID=96639 /ORGANISM=" , Strain NY0313808BC1" /LENGTH=81 /DNA_ID=CAMNT_0050651097 /DNA_START=93 /DNA_END=335 /DNA_ORIENTATION=+
MTTIESLDLKSMDLRCDKSAAVLVAGSSTQCVALLMDSSGSPIGDEAIESVLFSVTTNEGQVTRSTNAVFGSTMGEFTVLF